MKSNIRHGIIRVAILILLWILSIPAGLTYMDSVAPNRRCAMGDVALIFFLIICFSVLWFIGLGVEAIILNRKGKKAKRNINLIMGSVILLFFVITLFNLFI